ncbi:AMP-binding protein [Robiginitalea marina]|uniref:AMP-binding protein n=1 Tax=Robiginitalea marina TaxID=2954105 RepID=A0ABT1AWE2_9FLAO|nr:AMP-binding protein [Robiginitalea marina]MCO5723668.1 AMP-binding protein [Robiginitalea marina]
MKEHMNPAFTLDGLPIAYEDLSEVAYSLIKEGEPYEREIGDFLMDWISASPDILQQTSGSTGPPKPLAISKAAMVESARLTGESLGLKEYTRALLCLPAKTIAGKMMLVRAMALGWKLHLTAPSAKPLDGFDLPVDFVSLVPLQLFHSLEHLGGISKILVGGAPLSRELLSLLPSDGPQVYESYGMTETASHIALRRLAPVPLSESPESILPPFKALPGITLEVDGRGCLVVHAPYLPTSPVVTNDLVLLESENQFRWLGRVDNAVNSGGVKLIPEQLEARIAPLIPGRFILGGLPDAALGEKLVLVLEGNPDSESLLGRIRESGIPGPHEMPREVFSLSEFAETASGKLDRPVILNQLQNH